MRMATLAGALLLSALACQTDERAQKSAPRAASTTARPPELPAAQRLSLERIFEDPPLAGLSPLGLSLSPDGKRVTFLRPNERDSEVLDLWAYELGAQAPTPLVRTEDLVDKDQIRLTEEERMALERRRVRHQGITSYAFCGEDGASLLFPLSGDLYHVTLGAPPQVRRLTADGEGKLDPRCGPEGRLVSFTRGRDLFVVDVKTGQERRLTKSDDETKRYGVAEFIAQEEMGRFEGTFFSPDERHLAFTEVDEGPVAVKLRPFIYADRTELFEQRYPAAGEPNAKVRLFVEDLANQRRIEVQLPKEDGYLARAGFAAPGALWVQWQSRDQKTLTLLMGDAPGFALAPVLEERDEAWVELHDDLRFFEGGRRFVWSSEREGVRRLYRGARGAPKLVPLTPPGEPVLSLVGLDEARGRVLYLRGLDRGREHALFSCGLDGGDERRVTTEPGVHQVTFGKGGLLIDRHSAFGVPPKVRLLGRGGEVLHVIDDNPATELMGYARPEPTFLTVPAEDGTPLNAVLLPPIVREEGQRYPLLVYVYGGPTAQLVSNGYSRLYPFFVHLTQAGYGVFIVDNRGTANRDRAFTRALYRRFGQVELEDQRQAVRAVLRQTPWIDGERVGIFGWSYGGYVSALAFLEEDSPFRAAVSVAPVTDWSLYDTHYTERYLGTPGDAPEAYARASVLEKAKGLAQGARALFLVHGMADDNVLFTHSLKLVEALQQEAVPFDFMAYPGRAHGLRGRATQLHVFRSIFAFLERELGDSAPDR